MFGERPRRQTESLTCCSSHQSFWNDSCEFSIQPGRSSVFLQGSLEVNLQPGSSIFPHNSQEFSIQCGSSVFLQDPCAVNKQPRSLVSSFMILGKLACNLELGFEKLLLTHNHLFETISLQVTVS